MNGVLQPYLFDSVHINADAAWEGHRYSNETQPTSSNSRAKHHITAIAAGQISVANDDSCMNECIQAILML